MTERAADLEFLKEFVEALPEAVLVVGENQRPIAHNSLFEKLWDLRPGYLEESDSQSQVQLVAEKMADPAEFIANVERAKSHPEKEQQNLIELRDGRVLERRMFPRRAHGRIVGRVVSFRDVTSRVRAERALRESEAKFRRISDANVIGILFTDAHGRIHEANDYFLGLVGYSRENLPHVRWDEVTPPEFHAVSRQAIEEARKAGKSAPFEKEYVRKDGSRVSVLVVLAVVGESSDQFIAYVQDITERKKTEAALNLSEERFRRIFESSAAGITVFDNEGGLPAANPAFCRMVGYTQEEISKLGIRGVSHPDDFLDGRNRELLNALNRGEIDSFEIEKRYVRKNGEIVWGHLVASVLRGFGGNSQLGIAMITDITQQKLAAEELRLSEERFRTVFEATSMGIAINDLQGRFLKCNSALCRMLGYTEAELMALTPARITYPEDSDLAHAAFARVRSGEADHVELEKRYVKKNGDLIWVNMVMSLGRDCRSKPLFLIGMSSDVTEKKRAEEAARKAIRVRDEFIAVASHELRTPVTPLKLQNEFLRHHLRSGKFSSYPDAARVLEMIEISDRQLGYFVELVEEMLDVSKIGVGRMELKTEIVDLADVVNQVVDRCVRDFSGQRSKVTVDVSPGLMGCWDRKRIEQAITNLLTNALKYGLGNPIEIQGRETGGKTRLVVRDRGIGISGNDQARIFEQFERAAPIQTYGGFGLGLYITREIVRAHGGTIEVESEPGKGSAFTIELALRQ